MKAEPQKEHQWLQQLVGEWTSEAECVMGPGQPPTKTYGIERVRMLGSLWMLAEGQGEMPGGGTANMIMTLGYDPGCVKTWSDQKSLESHSTLPSGAPLRGAREWSQRCVNWPTTPMFAGVLTQPPDEAGRATRARRPGFVKFENGFLSRRCAPAFSHDQDPQKKKYLGTWIGSMMSHLWHYDGEMDASGRVLTLSADGPSMAGDGTMAKYQDIIEIKSDDHRTLSSRVLGPDGNWKHFMTAHYRRKE